MSTLSQRALSIALNEISDGHTVLILFPDVFWQAIIERIHWPLPIIIEFADCLKFARAVDTVITVCDEDCNQEMISSVPCNKVVRIFSQEQKQETWRDKPPLL